MNPSLAGSYCKYIATPGLSQEYPILTASSASLPPGARFFVSQECTQCFNH